MIYLLFNTARDYTDEETPCSISNQEAKLVLADDTLPYWDVGKVGRCGLCFYSFILFTPLFYILYSLVYLSCNLLFVLINLFLGLRGGCYSLSSE